jgi:hypothetical protein
VRLDLPHQCVDPGYHSAFPDVLGHCEGESGETKWTKDQKMQFQQLGVRPKDLIRR